MTEKVETESVLEKRRVHVIISAKNGFDGEREEGIDGLEAYFKSLDMPVSLRELNSGVTEEDFLIMADKCSSNGEKTLAGIRELGREDMIEIYRMAF